MICGSDFYKRQSIAERHAAAAQFENAASCPQSNERTDQRRQHFDCTPSVYLLLCCAVLCPLLRPQSPFLTFAPSHTLPSLSLSLPRALDTHIFRL